MEIKPFISVIIPTYNRPNQLINCLKAMVSQDYPHDRFEVIVVDDGSPTPLDDLLAPFLHGLNSTIIRQDHAGPSKARNTGVLKAKGEVLVFTDDDCMPSKDWLQKIATGYLSTPDPMIVGKTLNALPDNIYSTVSQLMINAVYSYYNVSPKRSPYFTSNNMALPIEAFRKIGGFDENFSFAEDREFCDRWLNQGSLMTYLPDIVVYHAHQLTLRTFWRQHFNYGRGAFQYHKKRAEKGAGPFRPDLKFYVHLFRHPFSHPSIHNPFVLFALLILTQISNASGFFWERLYPHKKI